MNRNSAASVTPPYLQKIFTIAVFVVNDVCGGKIGLAAVKNCNRPKLHSSRILENRIYVVSLKDLSSNDAKD